MAMEKPYDTKRSWWVASYIHTICAIAGKNVNYSARRVMCLLSENLKDASPRSKQEKMSGLAVKAP